jgi:GT2 family glycosyltransferase
MVIHPRVTVIVPCFNGAAWVATAVRSVLAQDFGDFELLLADDASVDDSIAVAREAAGGDSRLRILVAEHNRGMTANWNAALAEAHGEFVCKLDCDDAWRPGTLRALLAAFEARPGLTAAFCRTLQCDAELEPSGAYRGDLAFLRRGLDPAKDAVRAAEEWYEWCFDDIQLWHSNAFMIRRELLADRLGGWDERFGCASDTDLILRVLELGGEVAHVAHVGVWYRSTPGSVSDTGRRQGWVMVEGLLACALSLQRSAARRRLSRHLRLQMRRYRASLHEQLRDGGYASPARLAAGHASLVQDLDRMQATERVRWWLRCRLSSAWSMMRVGAAP